MTRESEIFLEALEQPSAEARAAFVGRATAGDPKLKEAVEALLANNQSDNFLEQGQFYFQQGDAGKAVAEWKKGLRYAPNDERLLSQVAQAETP